MISRDKLWKGAAKDLFEDLVRLFFAAYIGLIDFSKGFEFLEQEMAQIAPDSDTSRRVVDLLVKVFLKDGTEAWFLIHIEIQGYVDGEFPKRMFIYFYRILDRFGKEVTQLAILTDDKEDYHPKSYEHEFMGTKTTHSFNTIKLAEKLPADFGDRSNIFTYVLETAWLSLAKNRKDEEAVFNYAMQLKRRLIEGGFPKDKIRSVLRFLEHYVTFDNSELHEKLAYEIHQTKDIMGLEEVIIEHYKELGLQEGRQEGLQEGRQEGRQEGLQEGRQEGLQEGIRLSIQKMLEKNFLPEFVANTLSVELKMVQEVQQAMKNGSAGHHN